MKNIIVNIVRGAWGWKGLGSTKGSPGRPGVSRGLRLSRRREHKFGLGSAPGPFWGCVWLLRTSPGSSRRHFGDVLGALRELWEHFLGALFGSIF